MEHREQRRLYKLQRRVQEAIDVFDLARMGDKELDEIRVSGLLTHAELTKVTHAKAIRNLYGAEAALVRLSDNLQKNLMGLPDDLLMAMAKKEAGSFLKMLLQKEIDRREEYKKLNRGSYPTGTPWRDK